MARFANSMGIKEIQFSKYVRCFCTIGKTLCTYMVSVEMTPCNVIPDYIEVDDFLSGMTRKMYTMEEAAVTVYDYLDKEYKPLKLRVTVYCDDAIHMPATVIKE